MIPTRQSTVRSFDLGLRGTVLQTKDDVEVHLLLVFLHDLGVDDVTLSAA
jgi:hypothetical protein